MKDGREVSEEAKRLARALMRRLFKRHRKPDLSRANLLVDSRKVSIQPAEKEGHFSLWLELDFIERKRAGERGIFIPLSPHEHYLSRQGKRSTSVQINEREGTLSFGLMTNVSFALRQSREAYKPRCQSIALDTGLSTLFATNRGDLLGQGWMQHLRKLDRKITSLAAARQKLGLRVRSERYDEYAERLRSYITTEVNRILNRLVEVHAPAEIVLERLDFRHPGLSKRMNRLLRNFGQRAIRQKCQELEERFGIVTVEINPAYSSQECSECGYVDKRNRKSQAEFFCLFCRTRKHADVNAACTLLLRRSEGAIGCKWSPREAILQERVRLFLERHPGPSGWPADPRLENPYFKRFSLNSAAGEVNVISASQH